jgi:L-rhamnose-H+ transport protein
VSSNVLGIALAVLGGALVGNCMSPLKRIRNWPWECTWLVFSFVSLLFVPCLLALIFVPRWPGVYASVDVSPLLQSFLFGLGWGIAQVLFGISVLRLGMALAFTIVVGLGTVFGTLIPFVAGHEGDASANSSILLMVGCTLMFVGVAASGYAGRLRESSQSSAHSGYLAGLIVAVISGVLSSMLNLSLAFGKPVAEAFIQYGAASSTAVFAVWPVALAGGLIPNAAYALFLLRRNRSWGKFENSWKDGLWSALMGLLWIGAVAIYGVATRFLGHLGDSAGWAIYQITMVLAANVAGVLFGEWRAASRRASLVLCAGVIVLILATVTVAFSTE